MFVCSKICGVGVLRDGIPTSSGCMAEIIINGIPECLSHQ